MSVVPVHVAAIVAAMSLRIAGSEVLTICIRVELRAIAGGLRYRLPLARGVAHSALTCFLIGPIGCRARGAEVRGDPASRDCDDNNSGFGRSACEMRR